MRALRLHHTGGVPGLEDIEPPPCDVAGAHGAVLAASINPSDILRSRIVATAANAVIGDTSLPRTVGTEAVLRLDTGERVYVERAVVPYGTLADRAVGNPDQIFEIPEAVSDVLAVALGIAGLAGWVPLATLAKMVGGESVLVVGATGTTGQVALRAARVLGAGRVVAAGRRADTLARLCAVGLADASVELTDDVDECARLLRDAQPAGFDVVIDYVFGTALSAAVRVTAPGARVIPVGMAGGESVTLNGLDLLVRGVQILPYSNVLTPKTVRAECYRDMLGHAAAGRFDIDIDTYSLESAGDAWQRQATGAPGAKLVVVP